MVKVATAIIFACFLHEGGHYLAARCFGTWLKFRFSWGWLRKIPIPRFTWTMPYMERRKQKIVALAGFGMEFLFILIFYTLLPSFALRYAAVAVLHLAAYRFYAGENSDFKWMR